MSGPVTAAAAVAALSALGWLVVALRQRPQRGVLVLAALLPFHGLLLLVPHPAVVDGWKEVVVVGILAATFLAPPAARGPAGRKLPLWLAPAAAWFLLSAVSALLVGGTQAVLAIKIGFFYVLLFWAVWRCPPDARERDRLITVLMVTGGITAVVGLAQQVLGPDRLAALGYEYNTTIRTTGGLLRSFATFEQPFPFGLFLMVVLLVGLAVALADPRRRRNRLFLLASPVLVAGLLGSTVRSAVVGLAAGILALALYRYRGFAHALPLLAAVAVLVPTSVLGTFTSSSSLGDRTSGWSTMVDVVLSSPFGVGIGATGSAAEKTSETSTTAGGVLTTPEWSAGYQPDNYYVKTIVELGPLGVWAVVVFFVAVLVAAWRLARSASGASAALAAGIAASTVAVMVAAFFSTYLEIFPMDAYFWLLLGVLATVERSPDTPVPALDPPGQVVARGV